MNSLKVVFAGTPSFGLPSLEAIASSHHQLQAIYTQPDRPSGRGRQLQASAVKEWALNHHLPVHQPLNFKSPETIDELAAIAPDIIVVIAYGLILPTSVLELPRYGCINVHASLLPRWRGASPIQQAILQGDVETGVTLMQMDKGLDTGARLAVAQCDVGRNTASELQTRLSELAIDPLLATLNAIAEGKAFPEPQDERFATYAPKIHKDEAEINWHKPAIDIDRQIRAFNPWPMAYLRTPEITLRIHQAHVTKNQNTSAPGTILSIDKKGITITAGVDAILIERLQFPGSKAMSVADWLNGKHEQLTVHSVLQ
ncbi:MAG: methionyl-tRNA formyltransferase [Legionellales bacterium]|nr:methionyl-tRNA formyltransferase [Legionellales bacterium]